MHPEGVVTVGKGVRDPGEAVQSKWKISSMPGNSENSNKISESSNTPISITLGLKKTVF